MKKTPKIPVPITNTGEYPFTQAATYDNWALQVLDYFTVYEVNLNSNKALAYCNGYVSGLGTEFMRSWRMNPLHQGEYLEEFLDDFRKFCIPPNYQEKLWAEFNNIQQTVNERSRDIKQVATELETLKLRISSLTQKQLYYQFKKAMDPELHKLISPHIKPSDPWNDMIEMAVKYDSARKHQDSGRPTSNYSKKQNTAKSGNFGKGRYNHNNWNNNCSKGAYNKKNNNTNNNSHPKPSNQ